MSRSNRRCEHCEFAEPAGEDFPGQLVCHRYPPVLINVNTNPLSPPDIEFGFPMVLMDTHCGEWAYRRRERA